MIKYHFKEGNTVAKTKKNQNLKITKEMLIAIIVIAIILACIIGGLYLFAPNVFDDIFGRKSGDLATDELQGNIVEINFIDVGQGDCIIIRFPDGKNMIIDAGSGSYSDKSFRENLKPVIDSMGIKKFDFLMATHSDKDHIGYLDEVLNYYDVYDIYRPAFRSKSEKETAANEKYTLVDSGVYDDFITAAINEPTGVIHYNIGDFTISGEGYTITVYGAEEDAYQKGIDPYEINYVSPFCLLEYSSRSVLFTGDAEGRTRKDNGEWTGNNAEKRIFGGNNYIDCDVLKIGHHGSEASASTEFLNFVDPEYAVISVGAKNNYGHPSSKCLDRLKTYRDVVPDKDYDGIASIYRTDINGIIKLKIGANGGIKFEPERIAAA